MAGDLRGLDWVNASPSGERAERATEIVRADLPKSCCGRCVGYGAGGVALREWLAGAEREEDEVVVSAASAGLLIVAEPCEFALDGREDRGVPLRRFGLQEFDPACGTVAAVKRQLSADVQLALDEVDVAPAQPSSTSEIRRPVKASVVTTGR